MTRTRHLIAALGLATATGIFAPGCVVRGSGYVNATTTAVVYEEPPAPQREEVTVTEGHVWVRGHWVWRANAWAWQPGHSERDRSGQAYNDGRWERRGSSWHWVEGTWTVRSTATVDTGPPRDVSNQPGGVVVSDTPRGGNPPHTHEHEHTDPGPPPQGTPGRDVSNAPGGVVVSDTPRGGGGMYPTAAPPPLRSETPGPAKANYVWQRGRWTWQKGNWEWIPGHWERAKANSAWIDGRWELQGNYYVWVEGRWDRR